MGSRGKYCTSCCYAMLCHVYVQYLLDFSYACMAKLFSFGSVLFALFLMRIASSVFPYKGRKRTCGKYIAIYEIQASMIDVTTLSLSRGLPKYGSLSDRQLCIQ